MGTKFDLSKRLIFILLAVIAESVIAAEESPQSFTYEGTIYSASGNSGLADIFTFKFQILSEDGNCVLYEEVQNSVNLISTTGAFSLRIGGPTGAAKRTTGPASDPGFTMAQIFRNAGSLTVPTSICPAGSYSPSAGHARKLRVTITPQSTGTAETLSPDYTITSVPQALVAETIQGTPLSGLITASGVVTQGNMTKLSDGSDISNEGLHNHDSRYLRAGGSSTVNLGSGSTYTSGNLGIGTNSPSSNLHIEAVSPVLRLASSTSAGNAMRIDFYGNSATQTASIQSQDNSNVLNFYTGTSLAMTLDASQNVLFAGSASVTGTLGLGKYTNAQETTLLTALGSLGSSATGTMWVNSTTNVAKFWDGSSALTVSTGGGSGTLSSLGGQSGATQTFVSDTNVTLVSASNAHTLGWSGQLSLARGGTNASLTAANGGIVYSDASKLQITSAGTAGQLLTSNGAGAPVWASAVADSGTAIAYKMDSANAYATAGAKLLSVQNNGTEKFYVDKDGVGAFAGALAVGGKITNVTDPTNNQDAATKAYVATVISTNNGSYLPLAGGTLTGAVGITAGTVGSPSLFVSGDTNTGLWAPAADTLALSTAGAERVRVNSTGNVGIGVTSPTAMLHLPASTTAAGTAPIKITSGTLMTTPEAGAIEFDGTSLYYTNGSGRQTLTTGAGSYLALAGGTLTGALGITAGTVGSPSLFISGDTNTGLWAPAADTLALSTAGAERVRVNSTGNVGIGVTSPTAMIHLPASTTAAGTAPIKITAGTLMTTPEAGAIEFDGTSLYYTNGSGRQTLSTGAGGAMTSLGGQSGATQTFANDTNVTMSSATDTHTLGWTGQLSLARGGTNANLTAANGGIIYSTASALAVTTAGTAGQVLTSNGAGAPVWASAVADGAAAIAYKMNTAAAYSTAGAKLFSVQNNSTEKFYVDKDGGGSFAGALAVGGKITNVTDPTNNQDAATKAYVASVISTNNGSYLALAGDTLTGALGITAGTVGSPSLFISGDTNTGLWAPAADTLALSTAGAERMRINSTGNIGIGVTTVTAMLHLPASTTAAGTAPLKITAGTLMTTPEAGAIEFDGTSLYYTNGSGRQTLSTGAAPSFTNGGVVYSTATALAVTAAGTAGQYLVSNGTSAPSWTDSPATSNLDITVTGGTTGKVVYISGNGAVTDATNAAIATARVACVKISATSCRIAGVATGILSGATAGTVYFLSTAGALTTTPPSTSSTVIVKVGIALNATDLLVQIGDPVVN